MTIKTVDFPFNKDLCTVSQLKEAAETLDQIFGVIEARKLNSDLDTEEFRAVIGRAVLQYYEFWQEKYPAKEGNL